MKPTNVLNDTRRKNPNKADATELGPLVRRFLLEHLVGERNLARNTQQSYRDTLRLMLPFMARQACTRIERLTVEALTAQRVRAFLLELETKRHCAIATRNQRLAAIHSLAHFIARRAPEVHWLVRRTLRDPIQTLRTAGDYLFGKDGDGRFVGGAGYQHSSRTARLRTVALSLQHRRAGR